MSGLSNLVPEGLRFSKPVVASFLAVGISATVVAMGVGSMFGSLFAPSVSAEEADPLASLEPDSLAFIEKSRKRFEGRSMYSPPPAPAPKRPKLPDPPKAPEPPKDPPPPPVPASYSGPQPTSVLADIVFFGEMKVRLGESEAGVKVLAINAPYSVRLGHKGGEYDVPLLGRIDDRFLKPTVATTRSSGVGSPQSAGSGGATGGGASGSGASGGAGGALAGAAGSAAGAGAGAGTRPTAAGGGGQAGAGAGGAGAPASGATRPTSIPSSNPNVNPVIAPGDEPGADRPSGPGPGETLPSGAMNPLRPDTPGSNDPRAEEPQSEPESSGEGVEYVDWRLLPPPLSDSQIGAMNAEQLRAALASITRWDGQPVDDHSRARLDHERGLISQRLQQAGRP